MRATILGFALLAGSTGVGAADDKKPAADPKGTPVELSVLVKTAEYAIDTGGRTPAEYKKEILAAAKDGKKPLPAPKVELVAVLKNTGDKPIQVWIAGDAVVMTLELKGEGAVNDVATGRVFTREFRVPKPVELAPGKTVEIPIKSLEYGFRNASFASYWTAPGEYELVAKIKTGVSPAPPGAKDQDGFGLVTLTSVPVKVTVEGKK